MSVELALASDDLLGECPVWDAGRLHWIDGRRGRLSSWDPSSGDIVRWQLDEWVGSFAITPSGGYLLSTADGFRLVNRQGCGRHDVMRIPPVGDIRLNDGKCDPDGRFWAGELDGDRDGASGSVYRVAGDLSVQRFPPRYVVFNSLCWRPDGGTAYTADTWRGLLFAHDFDTDSGVMGEPRVLAEFTGAGRPDGATVDTDGCLWVAMVDGWEVLRLTPAGEVDRRIPLPVKRPTSCTFGGPGLDVLYVTTATTRQTDTELARQPLAGSVLAVKTGCRGMPSVRFAGDIPLQPRSG